MATTTIHSLVTPCLLSSAPLPILPLFSLHPKQDQSVTNVSRVMAPECTYPLKLLQIGSHTGDTQTHARSGTNTLMCTSHHILIIQRNTNTVQQSSMHAQTQNTVKRHIQACMHPPITCYFTTHNFLLVLYISIPFFRSHSYLTVWPAVKSIGGVSPSTGAGMHKKD